MPPPRSACDIDYCNDNSKSYNRSKYARRRNNRINIDIYRKDHVHSERKCNKKSRKKSLQTYTKFHKDQIKNNHHKIHIYDDAIYSNLKALRKPSDPEDEPHHHYNDLYHWYKEYRPQRYNLRPRDSIYGLGGIKIIQKHCHFDDCVLDECTHLGATYYKILLHLRNKYHLWIHADVNVMLSRPQWFKQFLINEIHCIAQRYQTSCYHHADIHTLPITCSTCNKYCCNTSACSYDGRCKTCITKNEYDAMHGSLVSALQVTEHNLYPGLHVLDIITQYSLGVVEYCSNPQCDNELCVFDTQLEYIHYVKRHGKSPTRGMCIYGFCDECLWGSDWDLCKLPDKDQCESDNRYYKDTYDPDFQICHAFKNRTPEICYGYDAQHSQFENDLCRFISLSPSYVVLHAPSIPKRHYYKYNGSGFYVWIMEQERNGVSLPIMSKRMYRREWIYTKMCKCMATYFGYQKLLIEWVDRAIDFATYDLSQVIIEADPMETNMVDVEHSDPDVKAYSMTKYNRGRNKREDHKARIKRFKNHKWNDKKSNAKSKKRRLKRYCKITNENIKNGGSFV
eukprot:249911_1